MTMYLRVVLVAVALTHQTFCSIVIFRTVFFLLYVGNHHHTTPMNESMNNQRMAHGKDDQNDLMLETVEQGVPMLKDYMAAKDKQLVAENEKQRSSTKTKKKTGSPVLASWWDLVPLEEFGVSQSFFLKVFLKWTIKEHDDGANGVVAVNDTTTTKEEDTAAKLSVNASKARRRLDAYLEWMHDNMATDMLARPLTLDSVKEVAAVWDMQSTISEGRRDRAIYY